MLKLIASNCQNLNTMSIRLEQTDLYEEIQALTEVLSFSFSFFFSFIVLLFFFSLKIGC